MHNCQCKVYFAFPKGMIGSLNGYSRSINVFLTLQLDDKHNGPLDEAQLTPAYEEVEGKNILRQTKSLSSLENELKDDQIFHISPAKLLQKTPMKRKTVWNG